MYSTQHPFLAKRRNILYYGITWTLLAGIHVMLLVWRESFPFYLEASEAVISSLLLALLGLALWYPVRFIETGVQSTSLLLLGYTLAGGIMLLLWLSLTNFFQLSLFGSVPAYQDYLRQSLGWKIVGGAFLYLIIILVYYLIISWERLREKDRQEARLETLVRESELKMLRSQINPHFLFNSLNSISSLTLTDPEKAREMVIRLSEFFRYSLDHKLDEESSLEEELKNIENYLAIEQVRFGNRFSYKKDIPEACLKGRLPNLILQPLFENAIKHGVYESTETVEISLTAACEPSWLRLRLVNQFDPSTPPRSRKGIGLQNITQRLELKYNQEGLIGIEKKGNEYVVTLLIPQKT